MINVNFYPQIPTADSNIKFAVIAARYQGQWIFCCHRERITWEIPGGHREFDESLEAAARRELQEETGATEFTLDRVGFYGVEKDGAETYGGLYFAEVSQLGPLPDSSEISNTCLMDNIPEDLTYPQIQPRLFEQVQFWLNMQSSTGEIWDIYDDNRNLTGRTHRRGDYLAPGDRHLVVHVWMQNSRGDFLVTKRSPNKGFPNMWETTGGSALAGDDSLTAAIREVKEETGLTLQPENGKCVITYARPDNFTDVWLFHQDFEIRDVRLQEGETCDVMYASAKEILAMRDAGSFMAFRYLDELFESEEGGVTPHHP